MTHSRKRRPWEIVVQLWTAKQGPSVFDLLLFLGQPLVSAGTTFLAARWALGRQQAVRAVSTKDLITKLSKLQMNRVVVKCSLGEHSFASLKSNVDEIKTYLYIAPTSSVWADALGYTAPSHGAEQLRWTFETDQKYSRGMTNWPSKTTTEIKIISAIDFLGIQKALLPILVSSLKGCPFESVTGGCVDLLLPDDYENDVDYYPGGCGLLANVDRGPRVFKSLNTKWDALHPFLIGPYSRCVELSRLLKVPTMLEKVGSALDSKSLGVLAIKGHGYHYQEYRIARYETTEDPDDMLQRVAWGQPEWYKEAAPMLVPLDIIGS